MDQVPGLTVALEMLAKGVGVGAVIAFLFERMTWFQSFPANVKWWLMLVISIGLPLAATALIQFVPAGTWAAMEPYWQALAVGFLIWAGSQAAHKFERMSERV